MLTPHWRQAPAGDACGLWSDPAAGRGYAYVVTGAADNPAKHPGERSRFRSFEEAILERLAGR